MSNGYGTKSRINSNNINIDDCSCYKVDCTADVLNISPGVNSSEKNLNLVGNLSSVFNSRHKQLNDLELVKHNSHINIIYFNARSLRNKIDELRILASQLYPDIIAVVESWLTDDNLDGEISIANYNLLRRDRCHDSKTKGGGLVIYFRQEIPFVDIAAVIFPNIEYMWVKINFKSCKAIHIGLFYRPPDCVASDFNYLREAIVG